MSDLKRFKEAQAKDYNTALTEIKAGRKRSHWMWYIFPQLAGLGNTDTSRYYAIKYIQEATDYLSLENNDAHAIFGSPDDLKLRSSMTLFDTVPATFPVFAQVLDKFYNGERDERTLRLLQHSA
jgi:uncharacterized protein (DUF1810 family)